MLCYAGRGGLAMFSAIWFYINREIKQRRKNGLRNRFQFRVL